MYRVLQRGNSADGYELASTFCKHDCRKGVSSELVKGATTEAGQYLFIAANVWWRCVQYFVIASCG